MNTQMVSTTQIQRDFKNILSNLASQNPTIVLRDSVPEAVLLSLDEYKRLINLEKDILKMKVLSNIDYLYEKNKRYTKQEIDKDIKYAQKHAPSRN